MVLKQERLDQIHKSVDLKDRILKQLAKIKEKNSKLKALTYINPNILEQLKEVKKNKLLGRLHGCTFSLKDHIDIANTPASRGSDYTKNISKKNSKIADLLLNEGALFIGKGNMSEYGRSYHSYNPNFGTTVNPLNEKLSAGGSSGGDAAAIAAGFCDFGIGSDTGGSIRIPASFCGLYGLFPTPGSVSQSGLSYYPNNVSSLLRSLGPIARTIDDLELLLNIIQKFDPLDPLSNAKPVGEKNKIKYFYVIDADGLFPLSKEVKLELEAHSNKLLKLGYEKKVLPSEYLKDCYECFAILWGQYGLLGEDVLEKDLPAKLAVEGEIIKKLRSEIKEKLPPNSAETLLLFWSKLTKLRKLFSELLTDSLVLLPIGSVFSLELHQSKVLIDQRELALHEAFSYSAMANILGLPALAFPLWENKKPGGLQLMGARFSESELIRVTRELKLL